MSEVNETISCIIPMYNTEPYIERCIRSVLDQSYKNVEVIVVDDGSEDASLAFVKKLRLPRNVKLVEKSNGGVSSARNAGIREATGEYIFFLDSDDFLPPDSFKILMDTMKQYSADLVMGRDLCFHEGAPTPEDTYCGTVSLWEEDTTLVNTLKDFPNTWNVCGKLFKRSIIGSLSFVDGKCIGEDSYFFFQCALKKPKTVYLEKNVYYVSLRSGSATRSPVSSKKLDDIIYFSDRKKNDIQEQFAQYLPLLNNLEIKAHLVVLRMLLKTDAYPEYEKKSIETIKKNKKNYISGQSNDRLYNAVVHHYYRIYKGIYRFYERLTCISGLSVK